MSYGVRGAAIRIGLGTVAVDCLVNLTRAVAFGLLAVLSACGGSDDAGSPAGALPVAVPSFVITGVTPQVETGARLQLASTVSPDNAGFTYRWDFGDGTTSTVPTPEKAYASPGTYALSLTVTGAAGDVRTAGAQVVVGRFSLTQDLRCTGASSGTGWCRIAYLPQPGSIPFFVDASHGWVIGDDADFDGRGNVFRTTDGGQTWTPHRLSAGSMNAYGLTFVDARNGFLLNAGTNERGDQRTLELWGTSDGGLTWARRGLLPVAGSGPRFTEDGTSPISVSPDGRRVAVRGDPILNGGVAGLQISPDGGATWTSTTLPGTLTPSGTLFQIDGTRVLRSSDFGATSNALKLTDAGTLLKIAFSSDANGWIYGTHDGTQPSVWRTRDGGSSWTRADVTTVDGKPTLRPHWLEAYGADTLILVDEWAAVFGPPTMQRSDDGGLTWRIMAPPPSLLDGRLVSLVTVLSDKLAYSGVDCNAMAVTQDGGGTWTTLAFNAPVPGAGCLGGGLVLPGGSTATPLAHAVGVLRGGWYRSSNGGVAWTQVLGLTPTQDRLPRIGKLWFHDPLRWDFLTSDGSASESTSDTGRTWAPKTALPGTANGVNVHYGRAGLGWAAPGNGFAVVHRTTDYGQTWVEATLPPAGTLDGEFSSSDALLHFINDREGWLFRYGLSFGRFGVKEGRAIWGTTDGGLTWVGLGNGPDLPKSFGSPPPGSMRFINASTGFVTEPNGGIAQTTDGGRTWRTLAPGVSGFGPLYFVNETLGFSLGRNTLLRTADGGATWTSVAVPLERDTGASNFTDIRFGDARAGWVVGYGGLVLATTDGGLTWTRQASGTLADLVGVYATDARTVWAVDARGQPIYSATGGH